MFRGAGVYASHIQGTSVACGETRVLAAQKDSCVDTEWQDILALRRTLQRRSGVQRVVLFGSLVRGAPGLTSDVALLIVWDTPLDFLESVRRT